MASEEQQSLYVSGILAAIGFSHREVTINRCGGKYIDFTDNLLRRYREELHEFIYSGSSSEGMIGGLYYNGERGDFDRMAILQSVKVFNEKEYSVSKEYANPNNIPQILVKDIPDKDYPGYARLVVARIDSVFLPFLPEKDGLYFLPNTFITQQCSGGQMWSSMAYNSDPSNTKLRAKNFSPHGPSVSFKFSLEKEILSTMGEKFGISYDFYKNRGFSTYADADIVQCIKCLRWPFEVTNFMTRARPGLWPGKETVEYLVESTPVFLAPVGHKSSSDVDLQWRFSFNVAEKKLIEDFNETQVQCYALLKIFLKDSLKLVSPNILSSYCMKTTMFWLSEREGKDNMIPTKLLHYFVECLKLIQHWLDGHRMPHYFIETRNVFPSNMNPVEVQKLMQALDGAILKPFSVLKDCKSFQLALQASTGNSSLFPKLSAHSYLIAWCKMRCFILARIYASYAERSLWLPFDERNILECIQRFKHMAENTKNLDYGQPFLKILKSYLGFLCFANHCDSLEEAKEKLSVKEIENLLLEGKDGDLALCPLKLATFYLREDKICEVLKITTSVLQHRQQIQNRHSFVVNLPTKILEELQLLLSIEDTKTLDNLVEIATTNFSSKAHHDEILYCREDCIEVQHFLDFPIELAKNLTFDVMFLLPETSAIPRAVQLEVIFSEPSELCGRYYVGVKISPLVYTLYLRFLAFRANVDLAGCIQTLSEFEKILPSEPIFYQSSGYNLLASCHAMMGRSHDAIQSLCCSLKITPTRNNVAFGYFAFVYSSLLKGERSV